MKFIRHIILAFTCAALAAFMHPATAARGDLDLSFNASVNTNANGSLSVAVQTDGRILIRGAFTEVGGMARSGLARLHADGTLDQGFNPNVGTSNFHRVSSMAVQADGKIVIGGFFASVGDVARTNLARLNADGTVDLGFNAAVDRSPFPYAGSIVVQPDGNILIGGRFTLVNGVARNSLARLNADGTLDMDFHPLAEASSELVVVYGMAMQPEGKILVWGRSFKIGGTHRDDFVRLNSDGTLDTGFHVDVNNEVEELALQADGKILIAGDFSTVGGVWRLGLARLNADGTLDLGFTFAGDYAHTIIIAAQTDGKILIGELLIDEDDQPLVQLNANGTLDQSFNPNVNEAVFDIGIQADGKILIAGFFTSVNAVPRTYIARLLGQDASDQPVSLQARPSGNKLILSWATNAVGFTLQSTLDLTPPVTWMHSLNAPSVIDAQFTVTNALSGDTQFYRLKKL